MAININVNGESINYPQTGDTNWSDETTDFAVQTASAFGKIGLSSGTTVDIPGTLDVTGNATLDANLSVGGNASVTGNATITGNLTANGNSNLGNASGDTIAVTGILNVDSGVLYVDPTNNRVGINDTTPSQALDVTGNVAITGDETVGGTLNVTGATTLSSTLGVTGDVAINTNKFNITATSGNTTIAGTLGVTGDVAINTNKFNVTASSGDTAIAGTLGVTGNTTLTGRLLNSNGSVGSPSYSFTNETNSGWYRESAGVIALSVSGTKRMSLDSNGYLLKSNNVAGHFERTTSFSNSVVVNFDTAILSNTNYNTTNGRFTSPITGTYFFYVQGIAQTSNRVGLYFRKNGVQYTNQISVLADANPGLMTGCHTAIIQLNASEYIDVFSGYGGTYTYVKSCFFGFYLIG